MKNGAKTRISTVVLDGNGAPRAGADVRLRIRLHKVLDANDGKEYTTGAGWQNPAPGTYVTMNELDGTYQPGVYYFDFTDTIGDCLYQTYAYVADDTNQIATENIIATANEGSMDLTDVYEGSETVQDFLKLARAALVGLVSGAGTGQVKFKGEDDTTDRIIADVDVDGNRTSITTDTS